MSKIMESANVFNVIVIILSDVNNPHNLLIVWIIIPCKISRIVDYPKRPVI